MIPFAPVPKPDGFVEEVEEPGKKWLDRHPGASRPKDLWSPFKSCLADGFRNLCAYSAMYESVGTVDHFVSWKEDRARAYAWSNFRFAAGWINASKQDLSSLQFLDPFEIGEGWFELLLPSLQLVVSDTIPWEYRERAAFVLRRLHLDHDERVVRQRRAWMELYERGELTLKGLEKRAPLLAQAIRKRDQTTR